MLVTENLEVEVKLSCFADRLMGGVGGDILSIRLLTVHGGMIGALIIVDNQVEATVSLVFLKLDSLHPE